MSLSSARDAVAALREFTDRIDALDPTAEPAGTIELHGGGDEARLALTVPVVRALVEALRGYHDPRDQGGCEYCSGRLDDNLLCTGCGRPNGLFGRLVMERAARHAAEPGPATAPGDAGPG